MHDSRRIEHTAAEWLAQRGANGLAEEDQRVLESWLAASPRHRMDRHARRINLLQGEGYFDVAHDAARPFAVSADARRVVALGTRFAVRRGSHALRVAVTNLFDKVPSRDPTHTAYPY